jgi:SpoVK/Ycf46/Vps4 family AAA+-type ATPase
MNQSLMTRLFKTITGYKDSPAMKIAFSIVEDTRKKGHIHLADKLTAILAENIELAKTNSPSLKPIREATLKIPLDRRYQLPLATFVEHDHLRRHMILSPQLDQKIIRIEKEYLARERLMHFGLKPRKKILLYGSSGCGKSMAAERIAWDLGLPFYKVRFDTIISSYLGESASNLTNLFDGMRDFPCVLLLDEFDIIGKQREGGTKDIGEIHRIVNVLLGLLEEYDGRGILIATTNLEGILDKALYRRFDDLIEFPIPSEKEIAALLKQSLSAIKLNKKVDLDNCASKLKGISYALVVKIANDSAKKAILNSLNEISLDDLESSIEENKALNMS